MEAVTRIWSQNWIAIYCGERRRCHHLLTQIHLLPFNSEKTILSAKATRLLALTSPGSPDH
jgi:hypothetical protein